MATKNTTSLSDLCARDLMRSDVTCLSPDDTIESALQVFEDLRISGAPVVDSAGRMIGVLTLADIARPEHAAGDLLQTQPRGFDLEEDESEGEGGELPGEVFFTKEDYSSEIRGRELVGDWMAEEVFSARPEASLPELCEVMVAQAIHRIFVTEGERLVGVVTSFDVMSAVAGTRRQNGRASRARGSSPAAAPQHRRPARHKRQPQRKLRPRRKLQPQG